jgi:hypothetical protein
MSVVKDLERLGRGGEQPRSRYIVRMAQLIDLLPIGGKGGGKAATPLELDHCVWFVIAMAALATGGPAELVKLAPAYADLECQTGDKKRRLFDDIKTVIATEGAIPYGNRKVRPSRLLFMGGTSDPQVEMMVYPVDGKGDEGFALRYTGPQTSAEPFLQTPAVVVSEHLLLMLTELLKRQAAPESVKTTTVETLRRKAKAAA